MRTETITCANRIFDFIPMCTVKDTNPVSETVRHNNEARLPDFLIIGAQKSGTTWLWKMFRDHPDIRIPPKKEIHYFDREILDKSIEWYMNQLVDPRGTTKIRGEKTPCYAHLKIDSIRFIRKLNPGLKIILLLRNPVERSWSQARMEISKYNSRKLTDNDITHCVFQSGLIRNSRRTDYRKIVENWSAVFPKSQIFIGFYDEVQNDPSALLSRICAFLGVSTQTNSETDEVRERVWKSPEMLMPPAVKWYLVRRHKPTADWVMKNYSAASEWTCNIAGVEPPAGRLLERAKVWFVAYVATVPYNVAYLCYDFLRDWKMKKRIRNLERNELAASIESASTISD